MKSDLPPIDPKKQTAEDKKRILEACLGLKKRFGKRKWFDFVGQGSADGEFTLLIGSKTEVTPRRSWLCTEYKGLPVTICGPWPKKKAN